jgi:hypothetical protein
MRRLSCCFLGLLSLVVALLVLPTTAHADLQLAGRRAARRDARQARETPVRQGFSPRGGVRTGMAIVPNGFVPAITVDWGLAGGITDHFTLGVQASFVGYLGLEAGGGADIVAERFFGRGAFVRLGAGAQGNLPARALDVQRAGFGGHAGAGYEFRLFERVGLALSVDYDGRLRTDGRYAQMVLFGLNFRGYLKKKH